MALVSTVDPQHATGQLTAWLATRLPAGADPEVSSVHIPKESGLSAETVMFDASWSEDGQRSEHRLVARVAPTGPGLYMDYDIAREAQVMRAVADAGTAPVPRVRWLEEDPAVLGATFLVMDHIDGRVARDDPPFTAAGWVLELSAEEQARLYDNGLNAMAGVHCTPIDGLRAAFDRPDLGATLAEQHLGYVERMFAWASPRQENLVIEAGLAWLHANPPQGPEEPCLCWGDGRIGNFLFGPEESIVSVLDWEASTIATPAYDLGWWRFAMRHFSEGMDLPLPPGFPSGDEVVARFEALSGRPVHDMAYWETINAVRFCNIAAHAAMLMIAGGKLPPDARMAVSNPATKILADMLGIEVPAGDDAYYVGNR